jgi:hypothetical protein
MELIVNPEGMFRLDFDVILDGAKRQEKIHPSNKGEYAIASLAHMFFDLHVLRLIRTNNWVYESAQTFAEDYSDDCFRYLKTAAIEVYRTQENLITINKKVKNLIDRINNEGAFKNEGEINLVKASDFYELVDFSKLNKEMQNKTNALHEEAIEQEDTHVWVTLRTMRDLYEIILPKVMYVVRRAIKVMDNIQVTSNDNVLSGISSYLDWYESKVKKSHALYPVLHKLRPFYKVARNVASHHEGFHWDSVKNIVILEDKSTKLRLHVHEFQQNYRHLLYLCDLGVRGILSAFCGRDKGELSNELARKYARTFPENFPEGLPGRVKFYMTKQNET